MKLLKSTLVERYKTFKEIIENTLMKALVQKLIRNQNQQVLQKSDFGKHSKCMATTQYLYVTQMYTFIYSFNFCTDQLNHKSVGGFGKICGYSQSPTHTFDWTLFT